MTCCAAERYHALFTQQFHKTFQFIPQIGKRQSRRHMLPTHSKLLHTDQMQKYEAPFLIFSVLSFTKNLM